MSEKPLDSPIKDDSRNPKKPGLGRKVGAAVAAALTFTTGGLLAAHHGEDASKINATAGELGSAPATKGDSESTPSSTMPPASTTESLDQAVANGPEAAASGFQTGNAVPSTTTTMPEGVPGAMDNGTATSIVPGEVGAEARPTSEQIGQVARQLAGDINGIFNEGIGQYNNQLVDEATGNKVTTVGSPALSGGEEGYYQATMTEDKDGNLLNLTYAEVYGPYTNTPNDSDMRMYNFAMGVGDQPNTVTETEFGNAIQVSTEALQEVSELIPGYLRGTPPLNPR